MTRWDRDLEIAAGKLASDGTFAEHFLLDPHAALSIRCLEVRDGSLAVLRRIAEAVARSGLGANAAAARDGSITD